jgi:2-C-methyl-D-erythritol 4-phosphate cytidylyltransferase
MTHNDSYDVPGAKKYSFFYLNRFLSRRRPTGASGFLDHAERVRGKDILYTSQVMRVFVILPAAGIGTRMASAGAPKQFLEIGGVPVLVRSVKAFLAVPRVDAVCVAVRAQERERVEAQMAEYKLGPRVHMVEGGDHRQQSVGNALAALECDEDDVVLVHDAVRPLIDVATIERTIDAVAKHGAAIVGLPAVDTIKQVERTADGAIVTATIPRERIVLAQTPQGALFGLLRRAFVEAETDGFEGTDEASLLERAGIEVAVVAGSARNFKITQPGDIELAEFYLGKA